MKDALISSERRQQQHTRECSHVWGTRPIHSRGWGSPTSWREKGELRLYPGARKYQIQLPSWCKLCLLLVVTVLHSLHPPPQMESKGCLRSASYLGKYRQCTSSQSPRCRAAWDWWCDFKCLSRATEDVFPLGIFYFPSSTLTLRVARAGASGCYPLYLLIQGPPVSLSSISGLSEGDRIHHRVKKNHRIKQSKCLSDFGTFHIFPADANQSYPMRGNLPHQWTS